MRRKRTTHGLTKSPEYLAWIDMHQRCTNSNNKRFKDYGGRGIAVCTEWNNFIDFYNDMGKKPEKYTLERIDNNENYCKENCKWATKKEQARNRRTNKIVNINGENFSLIEACEKFGIEYHVVRHRLDRGWELNKALCTKKRSRQGNGNES